MCSGHLLQLSQLWEPTNDLELDMTVESDLPQSSISYLVADSILGTESDDVERVELYTE